MAFYLSDILTTCASLEEFPPESYCPIDSA